MKKYDYNLLRVIRAAALTFPIYLSGVYQVWKVGGQQTRAARDVAW